MKHIYTGLKFTVVAIFSLSLFNSCKQHEQMLQVNMTIKNNPQKQIVSLIGKEYGSSPIVLDTAIIVPGNTSCHFEIPNIHQNIYSIRFEYENRYILFNNDEPNINITVNWNNFSDYFISSPGSASLKKLLVTFNSYLAETDSANGNRLNMQNESDSIKNILKESERVKEEKAQQFVLHYSDTTGYPAVALYALGILQYRKTDSAVLKPLVAKLTNRFPDNDELKKISADYRALLAKQSKVLSTGKAAPLFSLPDTLGQVIPLESFIGKYTLVDFWASWCPPCRKENPSLVKVFNMYKEKNFTILGVSLDKDKASWLEAIHKDGLSWQQVSDLKEWDSDIVSLYNIEAIPFNVLLNPEGKIIAMNLNGASLEEKLSEVLK